MFPAFAAGSSNTISCASSGARITRVSTSNGVALGTTNAARVAISMTTSTACSTTTISCALGIARPDTVNTPMTFITRGSNMCHTVLGAGGDDSGGLSTKVIGCLIGGGIVTRGPRLDN